MTHFTVEVMTKPVTDFGWGPLRHILDVVPGTVLVEDPDEPVLMIPVEAAAPLKAAMFVDGLAKLTGIEITQGKIYPTPEVDYDVPDDSGEPIVHTRTVQVVEEWMAAVPVLPPLDTNDGRLAHA